MAGKRKYWQPNFRFGICEAGEIIYATTFRVPVTFSAETFVVPKCRTLFSASRLFAFSKNGIVFCTVEFPTDAEADANGWYLGTVDVLGSDLAGAPVEFADGDDYMLKAPDEVDDTGGTVSLSVLGERNDE